MRGRNEFWWEMPVMIAAFLGIICVIYIWLDAPESYYTKLDESQGNKPAVIHYTHGGSEFSHNNNQPARKPEIKDGMAVGPTEEFNQFLSDLKPEFDALLLETKKWEQAVYSNNIAFDGTPIRRSIKAIYTRAVDTSSAIQMLDGEEGCIKYTSEFWRKMNQLGHRSVADEFMHLIQNKLLNLLILFRVHDQLHRSFTSLGSADVEIHATIADLEPSVQAIEKRIAQFCDSYNGYFEKEAFLAQLNKIHSAKNFQELRFWIDLIETVSSQFVIFDDTYNVNYWREINEETRRMKDFFPLR